MSRRKARFTLKEVQTLMKAAQEANTRLVLKLEPDGRFRIIFNDEEALKPGEEAVLW